MLLQQLLCRPQSQSLRDLGAEPDVEVGFVDPHPVQDTGKLARDRDDRAQHARPFGDPQAPGPQCRPLTKALPEKSQTRVVVDSHRGVAAATFRKPNIAVGIDLTKRHSRTGSSHLAGEDAARKFVKYRAELRREKRREEREKGRKRHQRRGVSVSTDVRNRGTQAFWAMPVEAMN